MASIPCKKNIKKKIHVENQEKVDISSARANIENQKAKIQNSKL